MFRKKKQSVPVPKSPPAAIAQRRPVPPKVSVSDCLQQAQAALRKLRLLNPGDLQAFPLLNEIQRLVQQLKDATASLPHADRDAWNYQISDLEDDFRDLADVVVARADAAPKPEPRPMSSSSARFPHPATPVSTPLQASSSGRVQQAVALFSLQESLRANGGQVGIKRVQPGPQHTSSSEPNRLQQLPQYQYSQQPHQPQQQPAYTPASTPPSRVPSSHIHLSEEERELLAQKQHALLLKHQKYIEQQRLAQLQHQQEQQHLNWAGPSASAAPAALAAGTGQYAQQQQQNPSPAFLTYNGLQQVRVGYDDLGGAQRREPPSLDSSVQPTPHAYSLNASQSASTCLSPAWSSNAAAQAGLAAGIPGRSSAATSLAGGAAGTEGTGVGSAGAQHLPAAHAIGHNGLTQQAPASSRAEVPSAGTGGDAGEEDLFSGLDIVATEDLPSGRAEQHQPSVHGTRAISQQHPQGHLTLVPPAGGSAFVEPALSIAVGAAAAGPSEPAGAIHAASRAQETTSSIGVGLAPGFRPAGHSTPHPWYAGSQAGQPAEPVQAVREGSNSASAQVGAQVGAHSHQQHTSLVHTEPDQEQQRQHQPQLQPNLNSQPNVSVFDPRRHHQQLQDPQTLAPLQQQVGYPGAVPDPSMHAAQPLPGAGPSTFSHDSPFAQAAASAGGHVAHMRPGTAAVTGPACAETSIVRVGLVDEDARRFQGAAVSVSAGRTSAASIASELPLGSTYAEGATAAGASAASMASGSVQPSMHQLHPQDPHALVPQLAATAVQYRESQEPGPQAPGTQEAASLATVPMPSAAAGYPAPALGGHAQGRPLVSQVAQQTYPNQPFPQNEEYHTQSHQQQHLGLQQDPVALRYPVIGNVSGSAEAGALVRPFPPEGQVHSQAEQHGAPLPQPQQHLQGPSTRVLDTPLNQQVHPPPPPLYTSQSNAIQYPPLAGMVPEAHHSQLSQRYPPMYHQPEREPQQDAALHSISQSVPALPAAPLAVTQHVTSGYNSGYGTPATTTAPQSPALEHLRSRGLAHVQAGVFRPEASAYPNLSSSPAPTYPSALPPGPVHQTSTLPANTVMSSGVGATMPGISATGDGFPGTAGTSGWTAGGVGLSDRWPLKRTNSTRSSFSDAPAQHRATQVLSAREPAGAASVLAGGNAGYAIGPSAHNAAGGLSALPTASALTGAVAEVGTFSRHTGLLSGLVRTSYGGTARNPAQQPPRLPVTSPGLASALPSTPEPPARASPASSIMGAAGVLPTHSIQASPAFAAAQAQPGVTNASGDSAAVKSRTPVNATLPASSAIPLSAGETSSPLLPLSGSAALAARSRSRGLQSNGGVGSTGGIGADPAASLPPASTLPSVGDVEAFLDSITGQVDSCATAAEQRVRDTVASLGVALSQAHKVEAATQQQRRAVKAALASVMSNVSQLEADQASAVEREDFDAAATLDEQLTQLSYRRGQLEEQDRTLAAALQRAAALRLEVLGRQAAAWRVTGAYLARLQAGQQQMAGALANQADREAQAAAGLHRAAQEALTQRKATLEERHQELREASAEVEARVAAATAPAEAERQRRAETRDMLQGEVKSLRALLAAKEAALAAAEGAVEEAAASVRQQAVAFDGDMACLDEARAMLQAEEAQVAAQEQALQESERQAAARAAAVDEHQSQLRLQAESLGAAATTMRGEAEALSRRVEAEARGQEQRERLLQADEAAGEELKGLERCIADLLLELSRLMEQRGRLAAERAAAQEALVAFQRSLPELEAAKRAAAASKDFREAARLSGELRALTVQADTAAAQLSRLSASLSELSAAESAKVAELDELRAMVHEAQRKAAEAHHRYLVFSLGLSRAALEQAVGAELYEEAGALQAEVSAEEAEVLALERTWGFARAGSQTSAAGASAAMAAAGRRVSLEAASASAATAATGIGSTTVSPAPLPPLHRQSVGNTGLGLSTPMSQTSSRSLSSQLPSFGGGFHQVASLPGSLNVGGSIVGAMTPVGIAGVPTATAGWGSGSTRPPSGSVPSPSPQSPPPMPVNFAEDPANGGLNSAKVSAYIPLGSPSPVAALPLGSSPPMQHQLQGHNGGGAPSPLLSFSLGGAAAALAMASSAVALTTTGLLTGSAASSSSHTPSESVADTAAALPAISGGQAQPWTQAPTDRQSRTWQPGNVQEVEAIPADAARRQSVECEPPYYEPPSLPEAAVCSDVRTSGSFARLQAAGPQGSTDQLAAPAHDPGMGAGYYAGHVIVQGYTTEQPEGQSGKNEDVVAAAPAAWGTSRGGRGTGTASSDVDADVRQVGQPSQHGSSAGLVNASTSGSASRDDLASNDDSETGTVSASAVNGPLSDPQRPSSPAGAGILQLGTAALGPRHDVADALRAPLGTSAPAGSRLPDSRVVSHVSLHDNPVFQHDRIRNPASDASDAVEQNDHPGQGKERTAAADAAPVALEGSAVGQVA